MPETVGRSAPRPRTLVGRADLLRLLKELGHYALDDAAHALGYARTRQEPEPVREAIAPRGDIPMWQGPEPALAVAEQPAAQVSYWVEASREQLTPAEAGIDRPDWLKNAEELGSDVVKDWRAPPHQPLVPWSRLGPWLRKALGDARPSREPDLPRVIRAICEGRPLREIPYRSRHNWAPRICVLLGHAPHLWTYRNDINELWTRLRRLRGEAGVEVRVLEGPPAARPRVRIRGRTRSEQPCDWQHPAPNVPLLVLSDLGILDTESAASEQWRRFGDSLARAGVTALALCPVPAARVPASVAHSFEVHEWDRSARLHRRVRPEIAAPAPKHDPVDRLIRHMAPALSVDAALLRALRLEFGGHAVLEAEIQRHPEIASDGMDICISGVQVREDWREKKFAALSSSARRRVAELLTRHHGKYRALLAAELGIVDRYGIVDGGMNEEEKAAAIKAADGRAEQRQELWRKLAREANDKPDSFIRGAWMPGYLGFQGETVVRQDQALRAMQALAIADRRRDDASLEIPAWADDPELRYFFGVRKRKPEACRVVQTGDQIYLKKDDGPLETGAVLAAGKVSASQIGIVERHADGVSAFERAWQPERPLARLSSDLQGVELNLGVERVRFEPMLRPSWACFIRRDQSGLSAEVPWLGNKHRLEWRPGQGGARGKWFGEGPVGFDEIGLYAEFGVKDVVQRCRWIEPGTFQMGSPGNEQGRDDIETMHEVTLSRGYWLADTACTQALWQAVQGKNPAHFNDDPRNPVEQVSWNDIVNEFLPRLNALVPGLEADLPTEAEWEYACRAGTQTPFHFGATISSEQVNFDGNYPYGNAPKGRYRGKTVPVASLPPNGWGLYEMHGNLYEWCADWFGAYAAGAQTDPAGASEGPDRVLRGGSWIDLARNCRSACRRRHGPGDRDFIVGFRLAPGRAQGPAEPAGQARGPGRGTRPAAKSKTSGLGELFERVVGRGKKK